MFELSAIQILIVLVVALLVFGPKRLPELGRQLGRGVRELKSQMAAIADGATDRPEDVTVRDPAPVAAATAADPADDDALLDGVVVDGATPPEPRHPAG